ncbi:MAG: hypothetical protein M1371_10380 [Actinobacteria bacterium]|nr:hypothetical protein [Actinomycetota bacterium]
MNNLPNIFTVENEDLLRLNPQESVDFFKELLWAEARSEGISLGKIIISSWVNVPDGGIDVHIERNELSSKSGLIFEGYTGYQIKSGSNFKPWQKSDIKRLLFRNTVPLKEHLGISIRNCLDNNGTYVLVCFGKEINDRQYIKTKNNLNEYFKLCGYRNVKIEIWGLTQLIGFSKIYPSLSLKLKGFSQPNFQSHQSWLMQDDMKSSFKASAALDEIIATIRSELRKNKDALHIRICGEPGIGKTRLVLEATLDKDLYPLVIYCNSATKFRDSELMNKILMTDNLFTVILVVDECDPDSRSYIWNPLKSRGRRIKLVSIDNDYDPTSGNILYIEMPSLEPEQICSIIQDYGVPRDQVERFVELCGGSPRVAHVIGWNLKNNPEDILKPLDTVNIWDRYIEGYDNPNDIEVKQRKLVLRYISLFKKFGYSDSFLHEAKAISNLITQADPQITWAKFQEIVNKLRKRKILQGETTLYITPKALHIWLWKEWWEDYGRNFDFQKISESIPQSLLEWFFEMFEYAKQSQVATKTVDNLLGANGPFKKHNYLRTELGANFFLALSKAKPESAMDFLENTVGKWAKEELLNFTTGRRDVVWALQKIAVWEHLFVRAANLLLALGEAENEPYGNNASGIFKDLFQLITTTEASPIVRFPVLKEAIYSNSKERRILALDACDAALKTGNFIRMIGAEYQGIQIAPKIWIPKTYNELCEDYHHRVWRLLYERLDDLPDDERDKDIEILFHHASGLAQISNLSNMVIDTLINISQKPYGNKREILSHIIKTIHYDGKKLPENIKSRLEQLRDELTGTDFSSLMKRYVGMQLWEDEYDEKGKKIDAVKAQIERLAGEVIASPELLESELCWLVTEEAQNGYAFGYELGKKDDGFSLLPRLLDAQRNANIKSSEYFLGGYLRAVFEKDKKKWEDILNNIVFDERLAKLVPKLVWRSGISDKAALHILNLLKQGVIKPNEFGIFRYGSVVTKLSEPIFKKWIEFLISLIDIDSISIALDLYYFYYLFNKPERKLPLQLTLKLLLHPSLFKKRESGTRGQMDDYHWTKIAMKFTELFPDESFKIAYKSLEHFGEDGTIVEGFFSQTQKVINEITKLYPEKIWEAITKYLGPPIDSRAFYIKEWLHGGEHTPSGEEGILPVFPSNIIWQWVKENEEKRAWYLTSIVPNTLFREEGKICWARDVLIRYGDRKDVRNELMANFSTEGWSGPGSLHYQKKKEDLLKFKENEDDENVKHWIDEYVKSIDEDIKREKIEEERRGF